MRAGETRPARARRGAALRANFWNLWRTDAVDLVARLTLVFLAWHDPGGALMVRPLVAGIALVGLLAGWHRRPLLWAGLFAIQLVRVSTVWWIAQNHSFLALWWTLGLATVMADREPTVAIRLLSRRLIGLAFACALVWKLALSSSFLDGGFVLTRFLLDERFDDLTRLFGVPASLHAFNRSVFETSAAAGVPGTVVSLTVPEGLTWLAAAGTAWTLMSELAVALTMLTHVPERFRHASLLAFCCGTYLVLPVVGFAWLLLLMGLAHTGPAERRLRGLYVAAAALIGLRALMG